MNKEDFIPFIGQVIKHKHSDKLARLLWIEDGCNGGLRIKWLADAYQISLPCSDFEAIK